MSERSPRSTVLLVDDDPGNLRLLLDALSDDGHRVLVAESGEEALDLLRREMPDAVLLDYRLPGIDGLEVCRRLKATAELAEIPILFLTAVHEVEEKVRALEAGAVDYVTKPVQASEALARLRTHLRIASLRRSLESEIAMRVEAEELLRDSLDRALVVRAGDGTVVFATRLAQTLLARHFPEHPRDRIPESVRFDVVSDAPLSARRVGPVSEGLTVLELVARDAVGPGALLGFGLTPREAEVLWWIAEGKTNAEIATILASSRRTVEKHVEHVLEKLGVENRATAARLAAERLLSNR